MTLYHTKTKLVSYLYRLLSDLIQNLVHKFFLLQIMVHSETSILKIYQIKPPGYRTKFDSLIFSDRVVYTSNTFLGS